jgi:hypothetical protein
VVKVLTTSVYLGNVRSPLNESAARLPGAPPPWSAGWRLNIREDHVRKESSTTYAGGTSIIGLLGIAFVVLKLCGVINWSWWWVTAPFWLAPTIIIVLMVTVIVILKLIR